MIIVPKFPDTWPKECPPDDAVDAHGVVYRIISGEAATPEDFKSYEELGLAPNAPACSRRSVSVFNSRQGACHRLKLSPRLGKGVAEGSIDATCGKMKLTSTKSGHIDWWPYEGINRLARFKETQPCP
ncbi:hypothetical protein MFU01_76810 [Myxococcus fulvus]|uniref:Uncharacterized protein n=1 Tax=Myxococcus fulvus TaxID=33 RepID=A0A511TEP2_MYXFU|nr:hypothetical protein MFU01_76810 [Myxococcus fulvus]